MKSNKIFLIAEIGVNHNGDIKIAKQLIDNAVECGFDAVKFQKRTIEIVYSKEDLDKSRESPWGTTQREQKEGLEFSREQYDEIDRYCKKKNIIWFASAWDLDSQRFLSKYKLKYNKIASAMLTNLKLLNSVAKEKKLTFISTGMSTLKDISVAIKIFKKYKCKFVLMHCVSTYPCPIDQLNLKTIVTLRNKFKCEVGYSGHEAEVSPSLFAYFLGANYIERHITLDRSMWGTDQAASLSETGMKNLSNILNKTASIVGNGKKTITAQEKELIKKFKYW
mgnify:CR=1 FL=1